MTDIQNYPCENKSFMIAAHARSGSTYLCQLLMNISALKVYLEIFHFKIDTIKLHLHGDYTLVKEKLNISDTNSNVRAHLIYNYKDYLKSLELINPEKLIAFKVFPKHLADQKLEGVIQNTKFIIILRRNLLHSYISNSIARKIQNWREIDTSKNKVEFSESNFLEHVKEILDYYQSVSNIASKYGIDTIYLDYENLIAADSPLHFLEAAIGRHIDRQQINNIQGHVNISRQDKRVTASQKVSNQGEMIKFLEKYNLSILNESISSIELDKYHCLLP